MSENIVNNNIQNHGSNEDSKKQLIEFSTNRVKGPNYSQPLRINTATPDKAQSRTEKNNSKQLGKELALNNLKFRTSHASGERKPDS